jgi:uncharacterized membrane protein
MVAVTVVGVAVVLAAIEVRVRDEELLPWMVLLAMIVIGCGMAVKNDEEESGGS